VLEPTDVENTPEASTARSTGWSSGFGEVWAEGAGEAEREAEMGGSILLGVVRPFGGLDGITVLRARNMSSSVYA